MPSFLLRPAAVALFSGQKGPAKRSGAAGSWRGVARPWSRGKPAGSSRGFFLWAGSGGGSLRLQPCSLAWFFLSWGVLPSVLRGYGVLWCLGVRAGAACGVGLGLVGWGGGGGGGVVRTFGGGFWCGCGCVVPLSGLSSCPPILFQFFCCSVPYVWPLGAFFFVVVGKGVLVGWLLLWLSCVCGLVGFVGVWVPICSVPDFCAPLFTCMPVPGEMVRDRVVMVWLRAWVSIIQFPSLVFRPL